MTLSPLFGGVRRLSLSIALAWAGVRCAAADDDFFAPSPFVQATAAFEQGDVARAEALALPLTSGADATPEACSLLGQIRLKQGRAPEAAEQFARAVAKKPESAPLRSQWGEALLAQVAGGAADRAALLARARTELETAAGAEGGCVDAEMGLLRYHLMAPEAGPAGAAEVHARTAAALDPLTATYEVAALAEAFKRFDLAEPYYREYARLFPNPWLSWKHGCMLAALGRPGEARTVFEAILAKVPDFELARRSLAELPEGGTPQG